MPLPITGQHCRSLYLSILPQNLQLLAGSAFCHYYLTQTLKLKLHSNPFWVFISSSASSIKFQSFALYQLHLVKAETARAFIPKEFRLVEAFGHTLGGFFLASYDDSPAGTFDELVVIPGIVWNPPTSCAWAARVFVNNDEACIHGRKDVGLPSQVARFSKRITAIPRQTKSQINEFLNMVGVGNASNNPKKCMDIRVTEINGPDATDICNISLSSAVPELNTKKWMGPGIKMSLPSYRVRAVQPAKISVPSALENNRETSSEYRSSDFPDLTTGEVRENKTNLVISVMLSKPILALEFHGLKMKVEAPTVFSPRSRNV